MSFLKKPPKKKNLIIEKLSPIKLMDTTYNEATARFDNEPAQEIDTYRSEMNELESIVKDMGSEIKRLKTENGMLQKNLIKAEVQNTQREEDLMESYEHEIRVS